MSDVGCGMSDFFRFDGFLDGFCVLNFECFLFIFIGGYLFYCSFKISSGCIICLYAFFIELNVSCFCFL